jgi:hypothetical protein
MRRKIKLEACFTIIATTNPFLGSGLAPRKLRIDIHNYDNVDFKIDSVYVSLKTNFIFFDYSKDIWQNIRNIVVRANSKNSLEFNISQYKKGKKITVKIVGHKQTFESDKIEI